MTAYAGCQDERCRDEIARLRATVEKYKTEMKRVSNRFKLMQKALEQQTELSDRFRQVLVATGRPIPPQLDVSTVLSKKRPRDTKADVNDDSRDDDRATKTTTSQASRRRSEPMTTTPSPSVASADSSPTRRRSLDNKKSTEPQARARVDLGSWRSRKKGFGARDAKPLRVPTTTTHEKPSTGPKHSSSVKVESIDTSDSIDSFFNDMDDVPANKVVVKRESPPSTHRRPPLQVKPSRHSNLFRETEPVDRQTFKTQATTTSNGKENHQFKYTEVVRNKEQRAALPAHDCIECREYYEALGEFPSELDMKGMCSRHRAKFEPYQTPDDFWRLTFPDSHPREHSD